MKIKDRYRAWRDKPKVWKKRYTVFISVIILIIACGIFYIGCSNEGRLIQESFHRTFWHPEVDTAVQIYSGEKLIKEYTGRYTVEQYKGYIVIVNHTTGERTDVYGSAIIVRTPEKNE